MRSSGGADREFWEDHWEGRDLGHAVRRLATDPVAAALDAYLPSGSRLLEGGCGQGEYVLHERGTRCVDRRARLRPRPVARVRAVAPDLPLVVGDVHALPFRGRLASRLLLGRGRRALRGRAGAGARRSTPCARPGRDPPRERPLPLAVAPHLAVVPARSVVRGVGHPSRGCRGEPGPFFQYVFSPRRFDQSLAAAHLRVSTHYGYGIIRGAVELGAPLEQWLRRGARRRSSGPEGPRVDPDVPVDAAQVSLVRRLLVAEDASVPGFGWLVRWLRWGCANMEMYVCRPR